MRRFGIAMTVLAAATLLTGCGAIEVLDRKSGFSVQAVALDACLVAAVQSNDITAARTRVNQMVLDTPMTVTQPCPPPTPPAVLIVAGVPTAAPPPDPRDLISLVVFDSEKKCNDFLTGLVLHVTATNSALDMVTTVFTALGTAFTPIATVHALTAGGSISSGWKTAIDSDIFAQATIANYAQAIQATYYTKMQTYINNLGGSSAAVTSKQANPAATDNPASPSGANQQSGTAPGNAASTPLNAAIETTKIETIHATCGLAPAQSTITATLQSKSTASTGVDKTIVTFAGTVVAGDTLEITFTSGTVTTPLSASVSITKGETPTQIMLAVLGAVTGQIAPKASGVMASPSGTATLTLQSPAADKATWKIAPKTSDNPGLSIVQTSVPASTSGTTSAAVPGSAVGQ